MKNTPLFSLPNEVVAKTKVLALNILHEVQE